MISDFNFKLCLTREWYGYHFPELVKIVSDNNTYAKVVKIVKNRKELTDELYDQLEEAVMDSAKAKAIIDASKSSMGNFIFHKLSKKKNRFVIF